MQAQEHHFLLVELFLTAAFLKYLCGEISCYDKGTFLGHPSIRQVRCCREDSTFDRKHIFYCWKGFLLFDYNKIIIFRIYLLFLVSHLDFLALNVV